MRRSPTKPEEVGFMVMVSRSCVCVCVWRGGWSLGHLKTPVGDLIQETHESAERKRLKQSPPKTNKTKTLPFTGNGFSAHNSPRSGMMVDVDDQKREEKKGGERRGGLPR